MKYAELKSHIASGNLAAAYYFTGTDEYLKKWSVGMFRRGIADYSRLTGEDEDELINALTSYSLGGDKRIVYVDTLPSDLSRLSRIVVMPRASAVLIVHTFPEGKGSKQKAAFLQLKSLFTEIDCSPLGTDLLMKWIAAETYKTGSSISTAAASMLITYSGGDLSRISTEIAKLSALRSGDTITDEDVRKLVSPDTEYRIWELATAVSDGDTKRALSIAEKFEEERTESVVIFGVLYKNFRNMFYIACSDEADAIHALEISSSAYYRLSAAAKKIGIRKLKKIIYAMSEIDYAAKSGKLDASAAVRTMIVGLTDAL